MGQHAPFFLPQRGRGEKKERGGESFPFFGKRKEKRKNVVLDREKEREKMKEKEEEKMGRT